MNELTTTEKFKNGIIEILKEQPENTSNIYNKIKILYPEECDDSKRCIHNRTDYYGPEWKHKVRSVQSSLKRGGKIIKNHKTVEWELVEKEKIKNFKLKETNGPQIPKEPFKMNSTAELLDSTKIESDTVKETSKTLEQKIDELKTELRTRDDEFREVLKDHEEKHQLSQNYIFIVIGIILLLTLGILLKLFSFIN